MKLSFFKHIGPGPIVAAAFIGPGTVTICTIAGVGFGFALLWALVLAIITAISLQEMASRLALITQKDFAQVLGGLSIHKGLKQVLIGLVLLAIVLGNTAYEAGNISGAILGVDLVLGTQEVALGNKSVNLYSIGLGVIAFLILFFGSIRLLKRVLISLVIIMSLAFLMTAILTNPSWSMVVSGTLIPTFPAGSLLTIVGLIGTTVVPYNLFLHSSLVKSKWNSSGDLKACRFDTFLSIVLGGIVSMSIIISAASINISSVHNASDLALALEPLFGFKATYLLAIGLFSAGLTSAVTAPLAASYVAAGCLGWSTNMQSTRFRGVWLVVLLFGVGFSAVEVQPIQLIKLAQVVNGIFLPIVAAILLWIMNRSDILGSFTNTKLINAIGVLVFLITLALGGRTLMSVF